MRLDARRMVGPEGAGAMTHLVPRIVTPGPGRRERRALCGSRPHAMFREWGDPVAVVEVTCPLCRAHADKLEASA